MSNTLGIEKQAVDVGAAVHFQRALLAVWARVQSGLLQNIDDYIPGLLVSLGVALIAKFIGYAFSTSALLPALVLGLVCHGIYQRGALKTGVEFTAKQVLRTGIALLGLRITYDAVASLGVLPVIMILVAVTLTILSGVALARALGLKAQFGLLSGGAVAICGASAALALSAVLPCKNADETAALERDTLLVVIGVTTLSTIAMVTYPVPAFMDSV